MGKQSMAVFQRRPSNRKRIVGGPVRTFSPHAQCELQFKEIQTTTMDANESPAAGLMSNRDLHPLDWSCIGRIDSQ